ncbi:bifunctional [glutamate--ammonia ligase]-adenylyl-L-tyrosine phosphorylase/[glutamate--ammonia-ligase] adenylyltransferase [Pelagerythrobacter marensis]|uniref:Bifunctional [glutamate--ammonia ligase]-adenylyl-L-tyrosine phosphorylase/[glutamate--ammonia-ligase] adenylyltransferase n=1 Tax=Pelagerythrobacter marensis TaxID=543877 RepID=A0ABZ2D4U7_9SPHN
MSFDWPDAIARARANAPFLARALDRQPALEDLLRQGRGGDALEMARAAGEGAPNCETALRRERLALATALAIGDLAGAFPLAQVMAELSGLADRALDRAIGEAIARRVEGAAPAGFLALALGKHGAGELNYSSDIDPILLYDPETLPRRARDEPGEAAQRYARDVVQLLSANTAEGYVFRVDLRLRPASEVSPLAISFDAALSHYESSALAWERAAFIRARPAAGDIAAGEEFLAAIRPFVWRRSLDFGAIEDIGRLTSRIREQYSGPLEPGPGFNLKQGRGGIREIEFFAQAHQLIHGGRDRGLRERGTRAALDALAAAGQISAEDARCLGDSYDRLRTVEHRLQMIEDHQTHTLPEGEALDRVARLDGLADGAALLADLRPLCADVAARYARLLDKDGRTPAAPAGAGESLPARLERLGFADPEALAERIAGWSDGRIRSLRSEAARASFDALLPRLLEALAEAPDPRRALILWEDLITKASSAINLFRLLDARPALLDQLVGVLTLAPPLAEELARRPDLLDALIDRSALDLPGDVPELAARMARGETGDDYEAALDRIRIVTAETRFALGVQLIERVHDPLEIAAALSRTAEAALDIAARTTEQDFAARHGTVPGGELLVLGLGRLGGGALTHASDLDIVYLFTGDHGAESDGERPLGATLYFNRLAQRVSGALSVPTAQGALYEVDTRLRPQGAQGPLAVSLDSFARYQREDAWTWEHMALTRARPLYGSPEARAALESAIADALIRPRDPDGLRHDVLRMRADMAANKPPRGSLDAKLLRGGLVDLEFLVHFLQLRESTRQGGCIFPDLGQAIACLVERGLLPEAMREAETMMTRLLVAGRLLAPDLVSPPPAATRALAGACGCADLNEVLHKLGAARQCVASAWYEIFEERLETDR